MWRQAALAGVAVGVMIAGTGMARACGIDGTPSLSVDGRLVALNKVLTSNARADTWTPFVARDSYGARRTLLFAENRANVALSLPPVAFRYPWRWSFGDGSGARGATARHAYLRPGSYVVAVDAYFVVGARKQWVTFDKATVHVR